MILQALADLCSRLGTVPDMGWGRQRIPFLAVIDHDGRFVRFEDTREDKIAREFVVPILGEKKGNGIKSNLFWENLEYMFGIPVPTPSKPAPDPSRVARQHEAFLARLRSLSGNFPVLAALRKFADLDQGTTIRQDPLWPEVFRLNPWILLSLEGQGPVSDDPAVRAAVQAARPTQGRTGVCLVTGQTEEIVALEAPIKGVRGGQTSGGSLVAVNNKVVDGVNQGATPAFSSYLKQQGGNSPIGRPASFAYTTALNHLLARNSSHHLQVGDATAVFWSERQTPFEGQFAWFFDEPPNDDPARHIEAVRLLHESVARGGYEPSDARTRFFVLGLAPNAARLAVRFWKVGTVLEMAQNIAQHFLDLEIVRGRSVVSPKDQTSAAGGDRGPLSIFRMLVSLAVQSKAENIPPNLGGEVMRAILDGTPYPVTLLQAAIRRIRAERAVTFPRAAVIKACLNRNLRYGHPRKERELTVSLDRENLNAGYRLGRLFAALEKTQSDSHPGINTTIRDRFYGAASGSPGSVFGTLMRLARHHLAKLSPGLRTVRERQIQEIMSGIPAEGFPAHLDLADQGRFAIGYYHQMQAFYSASANPNKE